jgi:Mn2+/Fe2+ NRAMP family transporter
MVMLADTDAGSVITAAQAGATWGYRLLLPLILLVPLLFGVQEITVRLGLLTGRGHGELIKERFGTGWALLSAGTLFVACVGALITEFAGIAGVGELYGLPRWTTVGPMATLLIAVVVSGSYMRVERVGLAVGALELLFVPVALLTHPHAGEVWHGLLTVPAGQPSYVLLLAALVGAVIMPWMIFYQQGAVIDKGLRRTHLRMSRWDTALGCVLTQVIMAAVVVATAATLGRNGTGGASLSTITQIAGGLAPVVGWPAARLLFGLGLTGAAFVAALVVSLAAAWGVSEVFGWPHSVNDPLPHARCFYWLYTLAVGGGALAVLLAGNLVAVTVDVEVLNAILLPLVLGLLLVLEATVLPPGERMRGPWRYWVWGSSALVMLLGLYVAATSVATSFWSP